MSFSAGSMIARASSGSSSSINSVEPLMSANSAVTILRSPSTGGEASASSAATRIAAPAVTVDRACDDGVVSGAPQSPQNFSPGSLGAPQRAHLAAIAAPHCAQNLRPCRLSPPHFEQRISHPDCRQAFSVVAQALACDALNKHPLVVIRVIRETPLNRILPDVFEFLFQLRCVSYDVVETFVTPDDTPFFEQLVYLAGRSELN